MHHEVGLPRRNTIRNPWILAPGASGCARIIAPGVTGHVEMLRILVQNEYLMTFIVVM